MKKIFLLFNLICAISFAQGPASSVNYVPPAWRLTGNNNLATYGTNYLGTIGNQSILFRTYTSGLSFSHVCKIDSFGYMTLVPDTNGLGTSTGVGFQLKGSYQNNAYMQLLCPNVSSYKLKDAATGVEWNLCNQTFGGGIGLDGFGIGLQTNASANFLQLSKRGEFKTESFYANNLIVGLQIDSAGHIAMGSTPPSAASFRMNNIHRGGATGTGILINGQIATDVTTAFRGILIQPTYSNSASRGAYTGMISGTPSMGTNTLTTLIYYDSGTELAAATVTGDTYGYFCRPSVVATRNVWGFFANGTAPNMFKGPVTIASATAAANGHSLTVGGTSLLGGINLSAGSVTITSKGINTTAGDAATINSPVGRFRKDNSGTTFVLTNDQITANSIILLQGITTGITNGWQTVISAGAGSATITFQTNGVAEAPNANYDINFLVIN